ncbi:ArnT family glycosyltransferase [Hirschia litorea]|uniref:ArnT family glycosyltransferase n=1 Tax=Hirschia litorea TaxID=1199156 RepID=A0ABW2IKQ8_9PROT
MQIFDTLAKGVRPYIVIPLLLAVLSLPGVFSMPVMDRDEARFTQASSQMLETDDYVVIRFHDGLRNKKPVGIHWLQAASVASLSDVDDRQIWAFRVPSFLGAILAALSTFWAASCMFSRRGALISSILLGATLLLSSEAHIAKTDAAMVGFIALAMACLAQFRVRANTQQATSKGGSKPYAVGNKVLAIVFWFALAWGVLIKGPVAPMVVGLAIAGLALWERRYNWLKPLIFWPGPILFIWIALPWFIAVHFATDGAFLHESVEVDLGPKLVSGAEGHSAPPGTHLLGLPLMMWPSILFLIPGLALTFKQAFQPVKTTKNKPIPLSAWKFLLAWAIPTWIVFEAMPTKLAHYPMPTYPALAMMAGIALDYFLSNNKNAPPAWSRWLSLALFGIGSLVLLAILSPWGLAALRNDAASDFGGEALRVMSVWNADWQAVGAPIWPFALAIIVTVSTAYFFIKQQFDAALISLVVCALVVGVSLRTVILPNQTWVIATDAAMKALEGVCGFPKDSAAHKRTLIECAYATPPSKVRAITYAEPSFVFSLNGKILLPPKANSTLPPIAEDARPVWLININKPVGLQAFREIISQAASADRCVQISREFVKNYSNNDASELVAIAVNPTNCADSSS